MKKLLTLLCLITLHTLPNIAQKMGLRFEVWGLMFLLAHSSQLKARSFL